MSNDRMLTVDQTTDEVSQILKRYSAPKVAAAADLPVKTIYRIRNSGKVGTVRVLLAINAALQTVDPKPNTEGSPSPEARAA